MPPVPFEPADSRSAFPLSRRSPLSHANPMKSPPPRKRFWLSARIKEEAQRLGFELVGISPAKFPPHEESFAAWLRQGFAGGLIYMERTRGLGRGRGATIITR